MSSAHLLEASRATRLDASQGTEALPNVPFDMRQKIVYPSLYPLPGASHPPLALPPDAALAAYPPLASGAYSVGGVFYAPNHQGHNMISFQAVPIPPMVNPAPPTSSTNLYATHYPFYVMSVESVNGTTHPLASEATGHHEQPFPFPFTFQSPLPTQPEAALDQSQVQLLQHHRQATQENLAVEGPLREHGDIHREDRQTRQESSVPLVSPEVHLCTDRLHSESDAPEENAPIHVCSNNPLTACFGHGLVCIDILATFVRENPDALSAEQITDLVLASIAPPELNEGQPAGQSSQVDTNGPLPSQHSQMGQGMASPALSATASTSTSADPSPTGLFLHPQAPNHSAAPSSSMGSTGYSAAKRKRSEDSLEDRSEEQQEECDAQGDQAPDCSKKPRKKKKLPDNEEYICRICLILGLMYKPLSRKDSLKRHIEVMHKMLTALFGHEIINILKPRRKDQHEDLMPLLVFCISTQIEAQRRGEAIEPSNDFVSLYPQIVALLNQS